MPYPSVLIFPFPTVLCSLSNDPNVLHPSWLLWTSSLDQDALQLSVCVCYPRCSINTRLRYMQKIITKTILVKIKKSTTPFIPITEKISCETLMDHTHDIYLFVRRHFKIQCNQIMVQNNSTFCAKQYHGWKIMSFETFSSFGAIVKDRSASHYYPFHPHIT